jgi:uncharacterized RDD family membrane protein YckC
VSVLPYLGYLVVTEAGARHATVGKRRVGLRVRDRTASSPRLRQVLLRNIVKVLPWQFGHLAASRFATGGDQSEGTVWFTLSMLLLVAVAGPRCSPDPASTTCSPGHGCVIAAARAWRPVDARALVGR